VGSRSAKWRQAPELDLLIVFCRNDAAHAPPRQHGFDHILAVKAARLQQGDNLVLLCSGGDGGDASPRCSRRIHGATSIPDRRRQRQHSSGIEDRKSHVVEAISKGAGAAWIGKMADEHRHRHPCVRTAFRSACAPPPVEVNVARLGDADRGIHGLRSSAPGAWRWGGQRDAPSASLRACSSVKDSETRLQRR